MAIYSQNNEQEIIGEYFKHYVGYLLDIGANDGKTFSNSLALIEKGWDALLIEPNKAAYAKLSELHKENYRVNCLPLAIGDTNGCYELLVNEPHIEGDLGLLSTLQESETKRWNLNFNKELVEVVTFKNLMKIYQKPVFDFITIDAEGLDYNILSQIDLTKVGCKLFCVEHNGKDIEKYIQYGESFGFKELSRNPENLIMAL